MDPVIRPATAGDADLLHALILGLAEHQGDAAFLEATPDSLAQAMAASPPRAFFLLAEIEARAVGFVSWTRAYGIWRAGDYLNLDGLYVAEEARGAGVGERLMRAFAAHAAETGSPARWEVKPDNHGAQRFYGRLGAEMAGTLVARWRPSAMRQG